MNDTELDEILDRWEAPPMRESLRDDVRREFVRTSRHPERFALTRTIAKRIAIVTTCAAGLLFAIVQVAPRTIRGASAEYHIPFYVQYVFERYARDGSREYQSVRTAFPYAGTEINMSVVDSHSALLDPFRRIGASVRTQIILAMPSLILPKQPPMQEPEWFAGYVRSGCSERRTVIGHETIAGHETTLVESTTPGGRMRFWLAPDLACFALKMTTESKEQDGTYRLESLKKTVRVTMTP